MMQAFFKDLVCHGDHNNQSDSSDGGDSPRGSVPRTHTVLEASSVLPKGSRKSRGRSLKKEWGSPGGGQIPVWEDIDPSANDDTSTPGPGLAGPVNSLDVPIALSPVEASIKIPTIARIPKHQRLSFDDLENDVINTVRANIDPETDRCKAMDMATKQAALREVAAKEMLNSPLPPQRSPMLGGHSGGHKSSNARLPSPPKKGKLGFGSSSRRLGSASGTSLPAPPATPAPPSQPQTARTARGCDESEHHRRGAPPASPMQKRSNSALQHRPPPGPPAGRSQPPQSPQRQVSTPRGDSARAPFSPQRMQSGQSPTSFSRLRPGPPRCPSNTSAAGLARAASAGRIATVQRQNSYMQATDSFSLSALNQSGAWSYRSQEPPQSARDMTPHRSSGRARMQTNSYIPAPPPQSNACGPPPSPHLPAGSPMRGNSYGPSPHSPMALAGSQPNLSPEPLYSNSVAGILDAGLAMCNRLFPPPPPRMLSFEPPPTTGFDTCPPPPTRMLSCEAPDTSSFMALPHPLPHSQSVVEHSSAVPVPVDLANPFERMSMSPLRQRQNSYEPSQNSYEPSLLIHH